MFMLDDTATQLLAAVVEFQIAFPRQRSRVGIDVSQRKMPYDGHGAHLVRIVGRTTVPATNVTDNRCPWRCTENAVLEGLRLIIRRWNGCTRTLCTVVLFLASDAASYVTGQMITVDDGLIF